MGLDNGVNFKILNKETFGEMPSWIHREEWEDKYGFDYEIFYWRKCWNVRNAIIEYLGMHENEYECTMTVYDLESVVDILERDVYGEDNWEDGLSIWTWEEIGEHYIQRLEYARKVIEWLKNKPLGSYEIYFYDSY
jgi:hypothetical protein